MVYYSCTFQLEAESVLQLCEQGRYGSQIYWVTSSNHLLSQIFRTTLVWASVCGALPLTLTRANVSYVFLSSHCQVLSVLLFLAEVSGWLLQQLPGWGVEVTDPLKWQPAVQAWSQSRQQQAEAGNSRQEQQRTSCSSSSWVDMQVSWDGKRPLLCRVPPCKLAQCTDQLMLIHVRADKTYDCLFAWPGVMILRMKSHAAFECLLEDFNQNGSPCFCTSMTCFIAVECIWARCTLAMA